MVKRHPRQKRGYTLAEVMIVIAIIGIIISVGQVFLFKSGDSFS